MTIRTIAAAIVALCVVPAMSRAQTSVTTDPVGYIALTAAGNSGANSHGLSFLGLSFTRPVEYQGVAASASGGTVTDNQAVWSDNQFNAPNGTYYLEVTSGAGAGRTSNIVATSAANKTVTLAADLGPYIAPGTTYKIRKNWTIAALFGANDESGLQGGTATTADQVLVYHPDPVTPTYTTYYYKTTGIGGTGWRTTASTSADASGATLNPGDGIIIRRRQAAAMSVPIAGTVKLGPTLIQIATGLNILSNVYPTDLTLGNSGLADSLNGGTAATADLVKLYDANAGVFDTYYYKTTVDADGTGWRSAASTSVDASDTTIPAGSAVLVQRIDNATPSTSWVVPQPFPTPTP